MARPLRLQFPGAIYHLTARGNACGEIYLSDTDRALWLRCLSEVIERFDWQCHVYCLMDNHYHLVIETPRGNLSHGMRQLNGVYTQRFNRRHGRVGHVFQGRYKAIIVERERYLLELCRYVVLNPVRADLVKQVSEYPWSSYPAMVGLEKCPRWLNTDWLLSQFGKRRVEARRRYADFVAQGRGHPTPWAAVRGQVVLGSSAFIEQMRPLLEGKDDEREIPRAQRLLHRPALGELLTAATQSDKSARNQAIRKAHRAFGYSMASIARHSGLHYSTVSKILKGER